jgi:dihydroorotate dehydrogenase
VSVHDLAAGALRLIDPERAHRLALLALRAGLGPRTANDAWPVLRTQVAGMDLPNPLGLAAGFDKDAEVADAMLRAGFGMVECGTVTPLAQPGNPRPRLFRLLPDAAVINRMGFNNKGLDPFVARLKARRIRSGVVGANIGANKDSPDRLGDYERGMAAVYPHADYVAVNVSSPNTPGLRGLQERDALDALLSRLSAARAPLELAHGRRPVFLKAAPDLDETAIGEIAELVVRHGLDGVIVSNTTIARPPSLRSRHRGETGGLSGRPLFGPSTEALRRFANALQGRAALIGVGGVSSGAEALAKIKAGAGAVQLYTALALQGPGLIARILSNLAARLRAEGFASVSEAVGADLA